MPRYEAPDWQACRGHSPASLLVISAVIDPRQNADFPTALNIGGADG